MAHKRKILTVLLLSATPSIAAVSDSSDPLAFGPAAVPMSPGADVPRTPPPDEKVAEALKQLRIELIRTGRDRALQQMPRFRPLCDADGYPLVGNIANKSKAFQPSAFCAEVRKGKGTA